jgi:hypothetical protein
LVLSSPTTGRRLIYVGEVRQSGGRWLVQRYELIGEAARSIEPLELPLAAAPLLPVAERLYLEHPAGAGTSVCASRRECVRSKKM